MKEMYIVMSQDFEGNYSPVGVFTKEKLADDFIKASAKKDKFFVGYSSSIEVDEEVFKLNRLKVPNE